MNAIALLAMIVGCSDYQIAGVPEGSLGQADSGALTDTAAADDTATPDDTGATFDDTAGLAVEPIYVNSGSTLYSWDPASDALSLIGDFHFGDVAVETMTDTAIDPVGRLYGISYDTLFRIDPETAEVWQAGALDQVMHGLTFVSDGRLVGTGDGVYQIDIGTGALRVIVPAGKFETSGDIIGLPDGLLYWTVWGGDQLVVVDPDSGETVIRGDLGVEAIYGLGYANEQLYGFTADSQALLIDPAFGNVRSVQQLQGSWWGATTNPVLW